MAAVSDVSSKLIARVLYSPGICAGSGGGADASSARYSETPFHRRKQQAKVFSHVSDYVARERAIIISGRTFTWRCRSSSGASSAGPNDDS